MAIFAGDCSLDGEAAMDLLDAINDKNAAASGTTGLHRHSALDATAHLADILLVYRIAAFFLSEAAELHRFPHVLLLQRSSGARIAPLENEDGCGRRLRREKMLA